MRSIVIGITIVFLSNFSFGDGINFIKQMESINDIKELYQNTDNSIFNMDYVGFEFSFNIGPFYSTKLSSSGLSFDRMYSVEEMNYLASVDKKDKWLDYSSMIIFQSTEKISNMGQVTDSMFFQCEKYEYGLKYYLNEGIEGWTITTSPSSSVTFVGTKLGELKYIFEENACSNKLLNNMSLMQNKSN